MISCQWLRLHKVALAVWNLYINQLFISASALLAMPTAVIATANLSVRQSVRHVPVFCPDEWSSGLQCQVAQWL